MASSEERLKILDMVKDGKISAEDGAKLLAALSSKKEKRARRTIRQRDDRKMRVRVTDTQTGKAKVSVNLPMSLVEAGLSIASNFIPDMGTDFDTDEIRDAIQSGMTGLVVDIHDEDDEEHIEVFIE
jgi:hypothetical protein